MTIILFLVFLLSGSLGTLRNERFITCESRKRLLSSLSFAPALCYNAFNKSTPTLNIELPLNMSFCFSYSCRVGVLEIIRNQARTFVYKRISELIRR